MVEAPPVHQTRPDAAARREGWRLLAPPLLFIAQFGAVYGWAGLVCAFGWVGRTPGPFGLLAIGVGLLTAVAAAALWWLWPPRVPSASQEEELRAYDPDQRSRFLSVITRMVGWLALAGMLAVAAMVLLARACAAAP